MTKIQATHETDVLELGERAAEALHTPPVVEFKVRYTCLDDDGDLVLGEYPAEGLADAGLFCERALAWQEQNDLPEDAYIVYRVGGAGAWLAWGGEAA